MKNLINRAQNGLRKIFFPFVAEKKLFFCAAMVAALMLNACGKKASVRDLPEDLRAQVEMIDQQISQKMQDDNNSYFAQQLQMMKTEISYAGVSIDGKDIVYTIRMGGKLFDVFTIEEFYALSGSTPSSIRSNDYGRIIDNNAELLNSLSQYGYHAILRYQGNQAGDVFEVKWPYDAASEPGLARRLPPPSLQPENTPSHKVKNRNVLIVKINKKNLVSYSDGSMAIDELKEISIDDLKEMAKEFILNSKNEAYLPVLTEEDVDTGDGIRHIWYTKDHVISVQNDIDTPYQAYLDVQNELVAAYNEIRDQIALEWYGKTYSELNNAQQKVIQKYYPMKISEAEPKDYTK